MALKLRYIATFAIAALIGAFAMTTSAQETQTPQQDGVQKRMMKGDKMGRHGGKRGFGRGMMGGHDKGMMRGLRGIELTEAQKAQIKQLHEANKPDASRMEAMKAIREAKRAGTITEAQKAELQAMRDAMQAQQQTVHAQVLAILTPEQRQQLEARKAQMKERMEQRKQFKRDGMKPADKPIN